MARSRLSLPLKDALIPMEWGKKDYGFPAGASATSRLSIWTLGSYSSRTGSLPSSIKRCMVLVRIWNQFAPITAVLISPPGEEKEVAYVS